MMLGWKLKVSKFIKLLEKMLIRHLHYRCLTNYVSSFSFFIKSTIGSNIEGTPSAFIRERQGFNDTDNPVPHFSPFQVGNRGGAFGFRGHFNISVAPRLAAADILVVHDGDGYHFPEFGELFSQFFFARFER